ncbi:MAG: hypothetical protein RLZZ312_1238 [Bacteroidota bacterium]|jgi:exopolyphosphatase/pppGpp-phosphohydrolase
MKHLPIFFFKILLIFFLKSSQSAAQNNLYAGIEMGSKGIKMSVLDIQNIKKGEFTSKAFWTENTALAKGIAKDGNLNIADIELSSQVVLKNYNKFIKDYKVDKKRIFVIASSGVGMANNTDLLVARIKVLLNVDLEIIPTEREARLLIAGGVPASRYTNSVLIDIGGGNTKGGYIDVKNIDTYVFFPVSMRLGTVTLTEKVKLYTQTEDFSEFLEWSTVYNDLLKSEVTGMFNRRTSAKTKKNIYFSGGAVWAFKTLFDRKPIDNFSEFTPKEVKDYKTQLVFDFAKFEKLAKTNAEVAAVLKTYDQKHLLSATDLLLGLLNNIENPEEKKFYFVKNGQMAWLVAYVLESVKGGKTIY